MGKPPGCTANTYHGVENVKFGYIVSNPIFLKHFEKGHKKRHISESKTILSPDLQCLSVP